MTLAANKEEQDRIRRIAIVFLILSAKTRRRSHVSTKQAGGALGERFLWSMLLCRFTLRVSKGSAHRAIPMATPQRIRSMVTAQPFRPFTVNLVGGRSFTVKHPENAAASIDGREMTIYDEVGAHYVEISWSMSSSRCGRRRRPDRMATGLSR
jgi:hypothetical protein